jgi:hypothetical protein
MVSLGAVAIPACCKVGGVVARRCMCASQVRLLTGRALSINNIRTAFCAHASAGSLHGITTYNLCTGWTGHGSLAMSRSSSMLNRPTRIELHCMSSYMYNTHITAIPTGPFRRDARGGLPEQAVEVAAI